MISSLTARIFAIFWFTLALVLLLVLMVPKLDSAADAAPGGRVPTGDDAAATY